MLQSLHVKNLALIRETEVEFGRGLNILTGETGAGKSLLIGSINLALGGKFEKEMLRTGAESALVELVFDGGDAAVREKLARMELEKAEDGTVIISRRMQAGRSVCKINGETVTAKQVKELAEVLIDIHGQHEHQSLLNRHRQMEILDAYCGGEGAAAAEAAARSWNLCREIEKKIREDAMDEAARARERALAEFEWQEIEAAKLREGEDEELEERYRFMAGSRKILESLGESREFTGNDSEAGAGNALGRALKALRSVSGFSGRLAELEGQLAEIEGLLSDFNRDAAEYMGECEFDEEDFAAVEERLNLLNHLKGKYGRTIGSVIAYGQERSGLLERLEDYDAYMERLRSEFAEAKRELDKACEVLSAIRKKHGLILQQRLQDALIRLNFLTVEFEIAVRPGQAATEKGWDDVEFLISVNPGEALKPFGQVASGGELSRVMLAVKTVLADRDDIDTLIFDEIDAGISGRTAWKVSEQLDVLARSHQVICITHLPQIAAMADRHFCIEKSSTQDNTITDIRRLEEQEGERELARLLGGDGLSEAAMSNAREMRARAREHKVQEHEAR